MPDSQSSPRLFSSTADFGHPSAEVKASRGGNGVHVTFPNGWTVSVQWGPGTYSTNHHHPSLGVVFPPPELDATAAEIAAWKGESGMIDWPDGDSVQGWQSWDDVQAVLDMAEAGTLAEVGADV